jgi:hypothetical protein
MNCLEFESQVEILARGALADARTRAAAEAHEESCQTCAARLADERTLSAGLRALAAGMKTAEAPARVETALLAAFRARAAAVEVSKERGTESNVVPLVPRAPARQWSWVRTLAVASLAAAASLALFVLLRPGAPQSAPVQKAMIVEPPSGSDGPGPAAPNVAQNTSAQDVAAGTGSSHTHDEIKETTPRQNFIQRARALNASYNRGGAARPQQATNASAQEVATEFIPLGQAGPYTQAEEGHLVRVELPRSALASFGLPVNAEAPGGRVKADVLMGQDGVARAIRFVR